MRLTELEPQWLEREGERVGVMFRCPHCAGPLADRRWITCFWVSMKMWGGETTPERGNWEGQFGYIRLALDRLLLQHVKENHVVPCDPKMAWSKSGDTFDTLTLTPSIDASAAGHWHGFITNGMAT